MAIHQRILPRIALSAFLALLTATTASAQNRVVLPQGSVIIVRTAAAIQSSSARVGQTFETVVDDTVGIDAYTVIPQGSRIRGIVSFVQAANRQQSGVIEVDFDRLILTDGTTYTINGKLTSVDSAERRQIESSANQRVVLVGGRGGIGAAIAGAGSASSSSNNILSALGSLLSEGRDVSVPAGTPLAVQLETLDHASRTARWLDDRNDLHCDRNHPRRSAGTHATRLLPRCHQRPAQLSDTARVVRVSG